MDVTIYSTQDSSGAFVWGNESGMYASMRVDSINSQGLHFGQQVAQAQCESLIINTCGVILRNP